MRLRSLTIKGFKSFADETVLHFNEDVIGHTGSDPGVNAGMYFSREKNLGVIVLINNSSSRAYEPLINISRQVVRGESTPQILESIQSQ